MMPALQEFIEEQRQLPMQWGKSDCTLLAADWVKMMTGVDPAERWRGVYSSKAGAMCEVSAAGGLCGFGSTLPWGTVDAVQEGDVAVIFPRRLTYIPKMLAAPRCAVCAGAMWIIKAAEYGVVLMRRNDWRVVQAWGPR